MSRLIFHNWTDKMKEVDNDHYRRQKRDRGWFCTVLQFGVGEEVDNLIDPWEMIEVGERIADVVEGKMKGDLL